MLLIVAIIIVIAVVKTRPDETAAADGAPTDDAVVTVSGQGGADIPVQPSLPADQSDNVDASAEPEVTADISAETWKEAIDIYEKKQSADAVTEAIRPVITETAENDRIFSADMEAIEAVFSYWDLANENGFVNNDILPDGLPDDNSLCIVILGYSLQPAGEMKDELKLRLDAGLEAAAKYPNAYVLVTGGGTALLAPMIKEADQMADYLLNNGLDPSRLIVENNSLSTSENAVLSDRLLRSQYPEVSYIAIVTSDYHVPMACEVFESWFIMSGSDLRVIANSACHPGNPTVFRIRDQVYWTKELLPFL